MPGSRSIGAHRAPDRHHQRDGGVHLLLRPLLGGVEVAPAAFPADRGAEAPLQYGAHNYFFTSGHCDRESGR